MNESNQRVWLITGCSKGFGRVFVEAILQRGERVFATARAPETLADLGATAPERFGCAALDVTDTASIDNAVAAAIERFGRIDVLVNNAGFGVVGPIEAISDEETRAIFDTNFFGTLNVTRAVLPHMRKQRSGHVIQVSSSHAWGAGPGIGMYSATKCALEGASETMAREIEPFGIRMTILQPGPYKTDFLGSGLRRAGREIGDYAPVTRGIAEAVEANHLRQPGDPLGVAKAMFEVVESKQPPLRLLLGKIATERAKQKLEQVTAEFAQWEKVALEADFA
jgi:NAD(P)-dependent dehydrogenase (short-subunit alcohol dehydrogenase family)